MTNQSDPTWRCEHPDTGDVKMAAKPEHRTKLEDEGYVCALFVEEDWFPIPPNTTD